ncbi:hypothetical protein C8Q80DRAFT_1221327 [Daedaleopsis nitida]|nr:hypothetical protein C8Q80DRAFT_1221327 [Daedaleopsis nitida]
MPTTTECDARAHKSAPVCRNDLSELSSVCNSTSVGFDDGGQKIPSDASDVKRKQPNFEPRPLPADTSNITTPPNTAPAPALSTRKAAADSPNVKAQDKAQPTMKPLTALTRPQPPQKPNQKPTKAPLKGRSGSSTSGAQKKKGKNQPMYTPTEYAKLVVEAHRAKQMAMADSEAPNPTGKGKGKQPAQFLKGKRIFFYGGDRTYASEGTRKKMELIAKHGGELVPEYDPARITHVVTADADAGAFLAAVGLARLADIPAKIPVVGWKWVLSGYGRKPVMVTGEGDKFELKYKMDYECNHLSFNDETRLDAGTTPWGEAGRTENGFASFAKQNRKQQPAAGRAPSTGSVHDDADADSDNDNDNDDSASHISEFTQDKLKANAGHGHGHGIGRPGSKHPVLVPLNVSAPAPAPQAAMGSSVQHQHAAAGLPSPPSSPDPAPDADADAEPVDDPLAEFYPLARAERDAEMFGLADDDDDLDDEADTTEKPAEPGEGSVPRKKKGGYLCDDKNARRHRAAAQLPDTDQERGRGAEDTEDWREDGYEVVVLAISACALIMEIINTGNLTRIETELTDDVIVCWKFIGIYGVGMKTARIWYNNGCRTLEDVAARKGRIKLSAAQEIGLRWYDDINQRIPRAEVQEIYNIVEATALRFDPKSFIRVMGSFRRGKADCGDIDVLITRPTDDGKTHRGILRRLLAELHRRGLPDDFDDLELCYRGLCRRDENSLRRRIDFLTVPWSSRGAALLYYTGDDIFNRSLRLKANKMGYSLNQRGLYTNVIRDPKDRRQKLNKGQLLASETEEEIFKILGVPWQEPRERIRN